jgi:hypothetical protein
MINVHVMNFLELIGNTLSVVGFLALPIAIFLAHRRERSRLSLWLLIASVVFFLSVSASVASAAILHMEPFDTNPRLQTNPILHNILQVNGLLSLYSGSLSLILLAVLLGRSRRKA